MTSMHDDLRRLVREQPKLSLAGLLVQLQDLGWQLELPSMESGVLEQTPAWVALLGLLQGRPCSSDNQALPPQLLESGLCVHLPQLVPECFCDSLVAFCDQHFDQAGIPPVGLMNLDDPLRDQALLFAEHAASHVLKSILSPDHPLANESFVLLMNRCLLRRTYPPTIWNEALRNSNNQHWHQDSNALFGARAMLTIWIPLQQGSGCDCPGLETISLEAKYFSVNCGDSTPELDVISKEHGSGSIDINRVSIQKGDGALFNGLTYHRTGLKTDMQRHRDALLLRLCTTRDAVYFPGDRSGDRLIP